MRVQFHGVIDLLQSGFVLPPVAEHPREVARDDRGDRIQRLRHENLLERLVEPGHRRKAGDRVPVMGGGMPRVELDGAEEFAFGACPVPVLRRFDVRQRDVRLGRVFVGHHSGGGARGGLGPDFGGRHDAIVAEQSIGVREAREGVRILAVFHQRPFEELHRFSEAFLGALIHVEPALEIEIARGEILDRPGQALRRAGARGVPQPSRHGLRHQFLQGEAGFGGAVETFRPRIGATGAIDDLHGNPNRRAVFSKASRHENGGIEFRGRGTEINRSARGSRFAIPGSQHAKGFAGCERMQDLLPEAPAEVTHVARGTLVGERQHRDGIAAGQGVRDGALLRDAFTAPEDRAIAALRQLNHNGVADAFLGIVFRQAGAQPAGLDTDDRVGAGIEGSVLVENLHADHIFLQLTSPAGDGFADDEAEKAFQTIDLLKGGARSDTIELADQFLGGYAAQCDAHCQKHHVTVSGALQRGTSPFPRTRLPV